MSARDARRQSLVEQDASNSLAPKVKRFYEEVRFTDLKRKKVWRAGEQDAESASADDSGGGVAGSAPAVTEAALGGGGSNNRIRPIDVDLMPVAKKLSREPPPEFLSPLLTEFAKLEGTQIELMTKEGEDGWTHKLAVRDFATQTLIPSRAAAFCLSHGRTKKLVISTDATHLDQLLIIMDVNGSRDIAEILADQQLGNDHEMNYHFCAVCDLNLSLGRAN